MRTHAIASKATATTTVTAECVVKRKTKNNNKQNDEKLGCKHLTSSKH